MESAHHREKIIASISELSVTPRVIRRLSAFLDKNPGCDLDPAIQALRLEPVLTAAILAASNAPTHFRGGKLSSLDEAVHRLGLRETYRVSLLVTFRQGLRVSNLPDNRAADFLWARAVCTGCAMEELVSRKESATAFTVGLLHLIGCLVVARSQVESSHVDFTGYHSMARAQEAAFGIAYPEVGAIALERWEFPREISEPIRWQLCPGEAGEFSSSATLLGRASEIATFIEQSRPGSPAYLLPPPDPSRVSDLARKVELRSMELMEIFHTVPLKRPTWARALP